jgi:peroxiredoxin
MVTVSPDTVQETARLRSKLGLGMLMLADPALEAISLYGVRHEKGFAATPGPRGILRPLAIPTALLVDERGVVRWIDQTDDYRIRSDAERVLAAIARAFERP